MYKIHFKGGKEGVPVAADVIVGHDSEQEALRLATLFFKNQPRLGIPVNVGVGCEFRTLDPGEEEFYSNPKVPRPAGYVALVGFSEVNPGPDASSYSLAQF